MRSAVADAVRAGLGRRHKSLPAWMFYDAAGTALYEEITRLPEYYLTRAEAEIFQARGREIVDVVAEGGAHLSVCELGAGSAAKTSALLGAVVERQGSCVYLACDIAAEALDEAARNVARYALGVELRPFVGTHAQAVAHLPALAGRQLVLYIGSSIGNHTDDEAVALLAGVRGALRADARLLLGTDLKKDPARLVRAYDDAAGVTASFNKNILTRINRELGAAFDLAAFRHVAVWNQAAGDVEMHLEAVADQRVRIPALEMEIELREGERIHTETSAKYDDARVDGILSRAGFTRRRTFMDESASFAVHVAAVSERVL